LIVEGASLQVSEQIRECYRHADHCARHAKEARDPALRQAFLDCERSWRKLARSYERSEGIEVYKKVGDLASWQVGNT
jgi:hypothetical protein